MWSQNRLKSARSTAVGTWDCLTTPLHGEVYTLFQPLSRAGVAPGSSTSVQTTL